MREWLFRLFLIALGMRLMYVVLTVLRAVEVPV